MCFTIEQLEQACGLLLLNEFNTFIYCCKHCQREFVSGSNLEAHIWSEHQDDGKNVYEHGDVFVEEISFEPTSSGIERKNLKMRNVNGMENSNEFPIVNELKILNQMNQVQVKRHGLLICYHSMVSMTKLSAMSANRNQVQYWLLKSGEVDRLVWRKKETVYHHWRWNLRRQSLSGREVNRQEWRETTVTATTHLNQNLNYHYLKYHEVDHLFWKKV